MPGWVEFPERYTVHETAQSDSDSDIEIIEAGDDVDDDVISVEDDEIEIEMVGEDEAEEDSSEDDSESSDVEIDAE